MFFPLSKILGFFALPSNLLITLALVGLALTLTRFARTGRRLTAGCVVLLALFGFSPLGNLLLLSLEERFPPWAGNGKPIDGVVVLGGAINPELSAERRSPALNESAERLTALADLAQRYPTARVIYSGGSGRLLGGAQEATVALPLLESFGIAPGRIYLEGRSRNTIENARYSKAMVAPKIGERWLLVTSAAHMPRAIGAFRKAGFEVEAHPVDWRTEQGAEVFLPFAGLSGGLARTDNALREWAGLFAYWITGRSSAFFPAP